MPDRPLLGICVPTYNRVADLSRLLACLDREIGARDDVVVLISDNASADDTSALLAAASAERPWLSTHRQDENVGANPNMRWLLCNAPDCEHLWLFGDDDLIVEGGLAAVVELLESEHPQWLFLPHRWPAHGAVAERRSPAPGVVERHATAGDLWRTYDHWLSFISASIVRTDALRRAAVERWTENAYQPLLWFFAAGLSGPCVVAPGCVVEGGADISWEDQSQEILTDHFTSLYDDGLREGVTEAEFAATLDGLYQRDHDMLHLWREAPLEQLAERTARFPQSEALRGYLWTLAVEGARADVLPALRGALQAVGADREAQALVAEGEQAFAAGDLVAAVRCFNDARQRDPTCVEAWNDLAVALGALQQDATRDRALERALFVAPDDVDALLNQSTVLAQAGDHARARQYLTRLLTRDPECAEAADLLASLAA